jgi:hypothetical protein
MKQKSFESLKLFKKDLEQKSFESLKLIKKARS